MRSQLQKREVCRVAYGFQCRTSTYFEEMVSAFNLLMHWIGFILLSFDISSNMCFTTIWQAFQYAAIKDCY